MENQRLDTAALTYESVVDRVRIGVNRAKNTGLSGDEITSETAFWASDTPDQLCLWFDSLDFLELVVNLEQELGSRFLDKLDITECRTVGDLASIVVDLLRES
jgi:hypothetical protein